MITQLIGVVIKSFISIVSYFVSGCNLEVEKYGKVQVSSSSRDQNIGEDDDPVLCPVLVHFSRSTQKRNGGDEAVKDKRMKISVQY